jgi:hypothetical protein
MGRISDTGSRGHLSSPSAAPSFVIKLALHSEVCERLEARLLRTCLKPSERNQPEAEDCSWHGGAQTSAQ